MNGPSGTARFDGQDPRDVELLERLRRIVEVIDPVPEHLLESGRALFRLHRRDADLMTMLADPGAGVDRDGAPGLAAVRGAATSRLHFFELGPVTLDVEVTVHAAFADIVGVVSDGSGTVQAVTLETRSSTFTTEPDTDGRFEMVRVPVALMRITLTRGSERTVVTPWFEPD